jgi:predicted ATPase
MTIKQVSCTIHALNFACETKNNVTKQIVQLVAWCYLTFRLVINSRKRRGNIEPGVGKWVSYLNREKKLDTLVGQKPVAPIAPKGIYLYGNVGSGKLINNFIIIVF